MINILYIIPMHEFDGRIGNAIASIPKVDNVSYVVSIPESIEKEFIESLDDSYQGSTVTSKGSTYAELVGSGLEYADDYYEDDDLISILEFDDVLSDNVQTVCDTYFDGGYENDEVDVGIYAPLSCHVKYEGEERTLVHMGNEMSYAGGMAEEFGIFDFQLLSRSNFLFVNGCYIRLGVFKNYGAFKKNFKYFYDYEWVLRVSYNGVIIKGIPKVTHYHTVRDDGAMSKHLGVDPKIRDEYLAAVRKEYFFNVDRELDIEE